MFPILQIFTNLQYQVSLDADLRLQFFLHFVKKFLQEIPCEVKNYNPINLGHNMNTHSSKK